MQRRVSQPEWDAMLEEEDRLREADDRPIVVLTIPQVAERIGIERNSALRAVLRAIQKGVIADLKDLRREKGQRYVLASDLPKIWPHLRWDRRGYQLVSNEEYAMLLPGAKRRGTPEWYAARKRNARRDSKS